MFNKRLMLAIATSLSLLFAITGQAQLNDACKKIQNGTFYYYPKNNGKQFTDVRNGNTLIERDTRTGDSGRFEVKWVKDCVYELKYVSGNIPMTVEQALIMRDYKQLYEITAVTDDYYIFAGHFSKLSNPAFATDTMWMRPKANPQNMEIIRAIPNATSLKKEHFSDTSKYAVLYLYRLGSVKAKQEGTITYFDNNLIAVVNNSVGYMYKILQEGSFDLTGKLFKKESSVKLDIKFGQSYYVKQVIDFGIFSGLSNFKIQSVLMPEIEGKAEFSGVTIPVN